MARAVVCPRRSQAPPGRDEKRKGAAAARICRSVDSALSFPGRPTHKRARMSTLSPQAKPTHVRYVVIGVTAFAAFIMYLDRMCLAQMVNSNSFKTDMGLTDQETGHVLGVFFFAYALGQMPAAWFGDRFGARSTLTWLIAIWSGFTLLTGSAIGLWTLMLSRIGCGFAEAGAFSCSGSLIPRWVPLIGRGRANSIVAGGGRLGGAAAPWLSAAFIASSGNWRTPGWIYGAVGVVFAGLYWLACRNRPAEHPGCNAAERDLIERDQEPELREPARARETVKTPWRGLLTSRDMWLMCLYQFLTNVGWVFLVTLMPKFLSSAKGLDEKTSGVYSSLALLAGGFAGMMAGGWLTDVLTKRLGLRQGRMIPLVWSRLAGGAAYLLCLALDSPMVAVIAFATVAAMTDISIPATWAYIQDVGGRSIASSYAWPNMWGNFGAGLTPSIIIWINRHFDPQGNWHASLVFLALAFLLSGFAAYWIRADVKIEPAAA